MSTALANNPPPPPPSTLMSYSTSITKTPPRPTPTNHNEQQQLQQSPKTAKDTQPPQPQVLAHNTPEVNPMNSPIHSPAPANSNENAPAQPATLSVPAEKDASPPLLQPSRSPTASPKNNNTINSEHAPAQLALLLSSALAESDALRRELALEKKRASRAERLLNALQAPASPNSAESARNNTAYTDGRLPESAAKAVVDAETRAEQAERSRDDALHALASLSTCFADLERYEAACALRASDARANFSRLLGTAHSSPHTHSSSSPTVSAASPREELRLNLPGVPAPLPALPSANHLLGPQSHLHAHAHSRSHSHGQNARYSRPLPAHASFGPTHSPIDGRQTSAFDSLPLPPPPSASVLPPLGTNVNVPSKRTHGRSTHIDDARYEEQKRRRLANEDGETLSPYGHGHGHRGSGSSSRHSHSGHYTSGSGSAQQQQQPLSAHPTATLAFGQSNSPSARLYDRPPSVQYPAPLAPGQSFHRDGPLYAGAPPGRYPAYEDHEREYAGRERERDGPGVGGLGRVDARELVRDAKARERRGRERESYMRNPPVPQSQSQTQNTMTAGRQRSASRSSMGSKDSMSLDEMLLETATERGRGRPSPSSGAHPSAVGFQNQGYTSNNGSSPFTVPPPLPSSQSLAKAPSSSMHAPATNGARKNSVPASQLMTLGPSGVVVSGGGAGTGAAAGAAVDASVDPAVRYPGLRTCRQCGLPGRYKEGKCVEKWGPGPQGPGTVCDRCRKKMKRVERRGTLDSAAPGARASQSQATKNSHSPLPAAPSYSQSYTQSQSQSQSQSQPQSQPQHRSSRAPARTDTLIVDSARTRSRSRSPVSTYPAASASARHPSLAGQPHYSPHAHSQSQGQGQSQSQTRRAPTPPYINSISTREQYGGPAVSGSSSRLAPPAGHRATNGGGRVSRESSLEDENDLLDEEDAEARRVNGVASSGARSTLAGYAHSYARGTLGRGQGEQDELEDDADGDAEDVDADADADGSGVGEVDADAEADADAEIMDAVDATMKVED